MEYSNEKLIAYLYGELPESEMNAVRLWLSMHPGELSKLEELNELRKLMGSLNDRELKEPVIINAAPGVPSSSFWKSNYFKAAASVLLFVVALAALRPAFEMDGNKFVVHFGEKNVGSDNPIPVETVAKQEEEPKNNLAAYQSANDSVIQALSQLNHKYNRVEEKVNQYLRTRQSDKEGVALRKLIEEVQLENTRNLLSIVEQNNKQHEESLQKMFTGFYRYYEDQRNEDIRNINLTINDLQQNNYERLTQTDRLLAQLVNNKTDK